MSRPESAADRIMCQLENMSVKDNIRKLREELPSNVELVAVSKFHPAEAIMEAYAAGQRFFAESRPQELSAKVSVLPDDIEWHFIGHLQTNKLKMVLPHVSLVQSVDSLHLLEAIDTWSRNNNVVTDVLLECHIASEDTKQGFSEAEILSVLKSDTRYAGICFRGLMGMATNTCNTDVIKSDFEKLVHLRDALSPEIGKCPNLTSDFSVMSFGMSSDYRIAVGMGANMVRIGTGIFGEREYTGK